jgi:hypothetical protein
MVWMRKVRIDITSSALRTVRASVAIQIVMKQPRAVSATKAQIGDLKTQLPHQSALQERKCARLVTTTHANKKNQSSGATPSCSIRDFEKKV